MSAVPPPGSGFDPLGSLRRIALAHPDRVAVIHGEERFTFAELDALVSATAASLAAALERAPLPSGAFVPAFMTHDVQSVVLLHAGFWVGAPTALIDPALPDEELKVRLATLGDFGVAMIPHESFRSLVPSGVDVVVAASAPTGGFDPLVIDPDSDVLALFSSGSTGRAKCIVHSRRGFHHSIAVLEEMLGSGAGGGPIASIGPFHWGGGFAIPLQLCNGTPMAIVPIDGGNAGSMVEALRSAEVESVILTPSLAMWLARSNPGPPLADLKFVALGGEALVTESVAEARRLMGPAGSIRVIWGASELNMFLHSSPRSLDRWEDTVPIEGMLEASIRLESTDDDPEPSHGGRVGEIVVLEHVTVRYLGQPELTALRFGVDPDGVRFWRSGDLAELLPDGTLFLRGRMDDMVKINGKLVEPAESLALLRVYPGVRAVEVLPHTSPSGRKMLVAHVVADDGVSPDELRRVLIARLPIHVIPGVIMRHEALPLTDRGKVDRQALQSMAPVAWLESEQVEPVTKIEVFLLHELGIILETEGLGVDDDMWFLGLDSLGATELLSVIADVGLGELSPDVLLEHRTVRALAEKLRDGIDARTSDVVTFNLESEGLPYFCVPGGGGTAIDFREFGEALSGRRPVHVVEAHGMHMRDRPDRSIPAMASRVIDAVDHNQSDGVVTLVGHSAGGTVAWEAAQELVDAGRSVRVVLLDSTFVSSRPRVGLNWWGPAPPDLSVVRRLTRWCRSRMAGIRVLIESFRPGRPRADQERYVVMRFLMARAVQRYELRPARFPVLYLASDEPTDLARWRALDPDLTVRAMEGDHFTMLHRPNVDRVVSEINGSMSTRFR